MLWGHGREGTAAEAAAEATEAGTSASGGDGGSTARGVVVRVEPVALSLDSTVVLSLILFGRRTAELQAAELALHEEATWHDERSRQRADASTLSAAKDAAELTAAVDVATAADAAAAAEAAISQTGIGYATAAETAAAAAALVAAASAEATAVQRLQRLRAARTAVKADAVREVAKEAAGAKHATASPSPLNVRLPPSAAAQPTAQAPAPAAAPPPAAPPSAAPAAAAFVSHVPADSEAEEAAGSRIQPVPTTPPVGKRGSAVHIRVRSVHVTFAERLAAVGH